MVVNLYTISSINSRPSAKDVTLLMLCSFAVSVQVCAWKLKILLRVRMQFVFFVLLLSNHHPILL